MNITQAELLEALITASAAPEDARTTQQLVAESGMGLRRVRAALHVLQAAGRLQCHTIPFTYIDGRQGTVPAYTILPKAAQALRRA